MIAALLSVTVGGVYVGSAVVARHRAQAAADLAALAAAAELTAGADAACARAASLVKAMGGHSADCTVTDLDVVVIVEVPVAFARWGGGAARAAARAGPL
jgi:secretion/DNA translocation related TadE-like protein